MKFKVNIIRTYYASHVVEVDAESFDSAREKAIDLSNDEDHTSKLRLADVEAFVIPNEYLASCETHKDKKK